MLNQKLSEKSLGDVLENPNEAFAIFFLFFYALKQFSPLIVAPSFLYPQ